MIDADRCATSRDRGPKDGSGDIRGTVVRPLVNALGEVADRNLFSNGQYPRALRAILGKSQLNGPRRRGNAGRAGGVAQIDGAGLTEGIIGIELAGIETQRQVLYVLAGEGAAGNDPDDLGNGEAAEIRSKC